MARPEGTGEMQRLVLEHMRRRPKAEFSISEIMEETGASRWIVRNTLRLCEKHGWYQVKRLSHILWEGGVINARS